MERKLSAKATVHNNPHLKRKDHKIKTHWAK